MNYKNWISEPFIYECDIQSIQTKIVSLIQNLNLYFGFVPKDENEIKFLIEFIIGIFSRYRLLKWCDMEYIFCTPMNPPELNKISPQWFESRIISYQNTEDRKAILKRYLNSLQALPEKTELTGMELLELCYQEYIKTGQIVTLGRYTFDKNYQYFVEIIGKEKMSELKDQAIEKERAILKSNRDSAIISELADAFNSQLEELKNPLSGLSRVVGRKEVIKYYFDNILQK